MRVKASVDMALGRLFLTEVLPKPTQDLHLAQALVWFPDFP